MINQVLPATINNEYKGHKLALYVFYLITVMTVGRSLVHMFATDGGAQSIATIPLDSYSTPAAQTVILIFALWGLSQLTMGVFYVIIIFRYKSLIPLMYIFLFIEYAMRLVMMYMKPIITEETAPGATGNYIFIPLSIVMFILSMRKRS
ncbi:hypothetical protein [Flammeovirga agarivorans]|uniref:Uncharacterized protein n=1 Tax=Flammeovirga agarivorans TaxID=2726742 RepID=A0A7X8SQ94_9BACT|nr:hypothetical protein [Flammeovirga agarivorans]NLR94424.1 hypothetical protein [Flammeovirga agarivorans]